MAASEKWQFWIDRGGPFTDVVARRADGTTEELGVMQQVEMEAGDVFVIESPGGGGFGKAEA